MRTIQLSHSSAGSPDPPTSRRSDRGARPATPAPPMNSCRRGSPSTVTISPASATVTGLIDSRAVWKEGSLSVVRLRPGGDRWRGGPARSASAPADHELRVRQQQVGVELEGELLGVLGGVDRALGLRVADRRLELPEPFPDHLHREVAHRPRVCVHLGRHRGEEAAARDRRRPRRAGGSARRAAAAARGRWVPPSPGSITCSVNRALGRLDRRQLQLLLGAEMGEQAALAHPHRVGQPADREPVDALDRGELCGLAQDRVAAAFTVAAALAGSGWNSA